MLRWVDLGWPPRAQQAALSFPSSAGQGREKIKLKPFLLPVQSMAVRDDMGKINSIPATPNRDANELIIIQQLHPLY